MEDIAPQLIRAVTDEFRHLYDNSSKIQTLLGKVKQGIATYAEAQEYALEVSRIIGAAYEKHISSATLPDGRMYYNIAQRLIPQTLDENYMMVSQYAVEVQNALNQKAGIGLKAQTPDLEQDRVDGLVDLASNVEHYDDVANQLLAAFETFNQSIVDETIRKNAEFHYRSGLKPKIIRKTTGKCCDWCRAVAGIHDYPNVSRDVYRRHANCRCTVLYDPADGSKFLQNTHTKEWKSAEEYDKIEKRKNIDPTDAKRANSRMFHTRGDPMREVTGSAEVSHPEQIAAFRKEIAECGAALVEHDRESLGYSPAVRAGYPGTVYVSKGASYSAWCHEMQHMREDRDAGWRGMRILMDLDERYASEQRAYEVEIAMAREAGREDIADRLLANLKEERRKIYGD